MTKDNSRLNIILNHMILAFVYCDRTKTIELVYYSHWHRAQSYSQPTPGGEHMGLVIYRPLHIEGMGADICTGDTNYLGEVRGEQHKWKIGKWFGKLLQFP